MQDQTVPQEANSQVDNKTTNDANSNNSELKNPQTLDLPQSSPQIRFTTIITTNDFQCARN